MHQKKYNKIPALLIAVLLCFGMMACGKKEDVEIQSSQETQETTDTKDRVVAVKAGNIVYYADELQRDLNMLLADYELTGTALSTEERQRAAQEILDEYTIRALIKARLEKLGLSELDKDTLYNLRSQAQTAYDAYWQKFRNADTSGKLTDTQLSQYLEENGINLDYFFNLLVEEQETQKILDYYKIKIEVSDADVDSFYEENYVKPSKERYENNIPLFEEEVVYGDSYTAYMPEGFRLLYQIVIPIPENIKAQLEQLETDAEIYQAQAEEAYNKIAQLAIEGKDTTQETEIYRKASDYLDEMDVKYGKLWQDVLTETSKESDEIYARMRLGESFEDLMALYNPNDFLLYHEKSQYWPSELMAGAATLKNKGDISQPTLCADGVHILCYHDDMPAGPAKLENADDRALVQQALIKQKTFDKLKELTDPWAKEFDLVTNLSAFSY